MHNILAMSDPVELRRLHRHVVFHRPESPLFAQATVVQGDLTSHDHDFMEVAMILGGTGLHISATGQRPLKQGDVIFLRSGAWHGYRQCRHLRVFNCCFAAELLGRELAWVLESPHTNILLRALPLSEGRFGQLILSLPQSNRRCCLKYLQAIAHTTRKKPADSLRDRPSQLANLVLLLDQIGRCLPKGELGDPAPAQQPHALVEAGIKILSTTLAKAYCLPQLARQLNTSPAYLIRLFKASTGLPPLAYLIQLRMEHAAGLLLRTTAPIGRIGATVGYLDANLFARRFKGVFALSPRDYRRRFAPTPHAASVKTAC